MQMPLTLECGELADNPGPMYVKIYLYFVVNDINDVEADFTDPLGVRATTIWARLRTDFGPHNIFFSPGFAQGPCTGEEAFEVMEAPLAEVKVSDAWDVHTSNSSAPTDGIALYVFGDHYEFPYGTTEGGASFSLPSRVAFVAGTDTDSGAILSESVVVSHEIGHCLGLLHTHHGNSAQGCTDDGSDPTHTGDLVSDTPPVVSDFINNNTSCSPSPTPSTDYLNIMSDFTPLTCKDHFTEGQGRRMRYYINEGLGALSVVNGDIHITTSTTWNDDVVCTGNIFIENNAVLIVNGELEMPENSFIFVNRGCRIGVRNLITSSCGKMWEGIIVDGNEVLTQTFANQGTVILTGATIENARCGVRLFGNESYSGGGILWATNSTFRNNLVDVRFEQYKWPNAQGKIKNISYFTNCTFSTTNISFGTRPPVHVQINKTYGVTFTNCQFYDQRTGTLNYSQVGRRARGIVADEGGFHVNDGLFLGLYHGVSAMGLNKAAGSYQVTGGAEFQKCITGIESKGTSNFDISGNTFTLDRPVGLSGTGEFKGVSLEGEAGGFTLALNTFEFDDTSDDILIGTKVLSLGTEANFIKDNIFNTLDVGNLAAASSTGLKYFCNTFITTIEDFNFSTGTVNSLQGTLKGLAKYAAGNIFEPSAVSVKDGGGLTYYYYGDDHESNPEWPTLTSTGITKDNSQVLENNECADPCPPPCGSEGKLAMWKDSFFVHKAEWADSRALLPTLTSPAAIALEEGQIAQMREAMDLEGHNILMHYSLDTTGYQPDSIRVWLQHIESPVSDWRLASHEFFTGNLTVADPILERIPINYDLTEDELEHFGDLMAVLEIVRPYIEMEVSMNQLPSTTLDSLEAWSGDCYEAGVTARILLLKNERELEAYCETGSKPSANPTSAPEQPLAPASEWVIAPNPAQDEIRATRTSVVSEGVFALYDLSGRLWLQRRVQNAASVRLEVGALPAGVYTLDIRSGSETPVRHKLVIQH